MPTGLTRHTENLDMGGYVIPEGVEVVPCIHLTHRQEDRFPQPDHFRPERFLDRRYGGDEYLPFGVGARRCLGASMAGYQLAIALAVMYRTPGFTVIHSDEPVRGVAQGPTMAFPDHVIATRTSSSDSEH